MRRPSTADISDLSKLPPLIKASTAARIVDSSITTMRAMLERGDIRGVKLGTEWRVYTKEFLEQFGLS